MKIAKEFCQALNRHAGRYITLPSNCCETTQAIASFQDHCRILQAVAAIDGTRIKIVAPETWPFDYFDRASLQCYTARRSWRKSYVLEHCYWFSWQHA